MVPPRMTRSCSSDITRLLLPTASIRPGFRPCQPAGNPRRMKPKGGEIMANILLIHGAYQGGWIWKRVAARLRGDGHLVLAPSLDGCAERAPAIRPGITTESQAAELAGLLFHEDLDAVTVCGTSTGGMVMCRLA